MHLDEDDQSTHCPLEEEIEILNKRGKAKTFMCHHPLEHFDKSIGSSKVQKSI